MGRMLTYQTTDCLNIFAERYLPVANRRKQRIMIIRHSTYMNTEKQYVLLHTLPRNLIIKRRLGPSWRIMRRKPSTTNSLSSQTIRRLTTGVNLVGEDIDGELMAMSTIHHRAHQLDAVKPIGDMSVSMRLTCTISISTCQNAYDQQNHDYGKLGAYVVRVNNRIIIQIA